MSLNFLLLASTVKKPLFVRIILFPWLLVSKEVILALAIAVSYNVQNFREVICCSCKFKYTNLISELFKKVYKCNLVVAIRVGSFGL